MGFVFVVLFLLSANVQSEPDTTGKEYDYFSGLYLGGGLFFGITNLDTYIDNKKYLDGRHDQAGLKLHVGKRIDSDLRLEATFKKEKLNVGSRSFLSSFENDIFGFGLDVIKTYQLSSKLKPFASLGISYHCTSLNDEIYAFSKDNLEGNGYKLGGGLIYQAKKGAELKLGLEVQHRVWGKLKYELGDVVELEDNTISFVTEVSLHL